MNESHENKDDQEPQVPPRLLAALRQLPRERIFIPPYVDQAVLDAARQRLGKAGYSRRLLLRPWMLWPAFAAILLVAWLAHTFSSRPGKPAFAREDVNHDGKVDILDAFLVARQVNGQSPAAVNLDVNGDGVVDRRDAEVIAVQAVKLEKNNPS